MGAPDRSRTPHEQDEVYVVFFGPQGGEVVA